MWKIDDNDLPKVQSVLEFGNPFRDEVGRFAPKGGGGGGGVGGGGGAAEGEGGGGGGAGPETVDASARMDIRQNIVGAADRALGDPDNPGDGMMSEGTASALSSSVKNLDSALVGGRKSEIEEGLKDVKSKAEDAMDEIANNADDMGFEPMEVSSFVRLEGVVQQVDGYLMGNL